MSSVCGGSEIFELQSPTLSVMSSNRQQGGKQEEEEEDSRDNEQKLLNKLSMRRRNAYNNASSTPLHSTPNVTCGTADAEEWKLQGLVPIKPHISLLWKIGI